MVQGVNSAGSFILPGNSRSVNRMGYGAMQLAGRDGNKLVWGPPRDVEEAIECIARSRRERREPYRYRRFLWSSRHQPDHSKGALPYPDDLVIVTKVGRPARRRWVMDSGFLSRRVDRGGSR